MELLDQSESELASYRKYRLANGLTVFVVQRPHTRTFGMCMELNCGMRDGSPHLAHLVEHLVLSRKSDLAERTGYMNGFTHFAKTRYLMSAHLDKLDSGLEMMKNVLSPLNVDKKQVRQEIAILAREFSEAGAAQMVIDREHHRVLGGDELSANYKKVFNGMRLKFSAAHANAFHQAKYQPANASIAIESPLEPDLIIEKISEVVGDFRNSDDPAEGLSLIHI